MGVPHPSPPAPQTDLVLGEREPLPHQPERGGDGAGDGAAGAGPRRPLPRRSRRGHRRWRGRPQCPRPHPHRWVLTWGTGHHGCWGCRVGTPLLSVSLAAPAAERDAGPAGGSSVAERLAEVARQPAFIAGVGGACWVILAAFAAWLYGRRRRKKELSHFAGTVGATPGTPPAQPRHPSPRRPPTAPLFAASFAYTPTGKPIGAAGTRRGPSPPSPPPLSAVAFPPPARGSPR